MCVCVCVYIYIYIHTHTQTLTFFFNILSIMVYHKILNIDLCAVQLELVVYPFHSTDKNLHLLIPYPTPSLSHSLSPPLPHLSNHQSVLYVLNSVSVS